MKIEDLEKYKNKISPEVEKMFRDAWKLWGKDAQMDMITEECSELIKEVCKLKRADSVNLYAIVEEMADVTIMIAQFLTIYKQFPLYENIKNKKLIRLDKKIQDNS